MRIDDRVQRRLRILRGKHLAVAAQGLQPCGQLRRHPLRLDDRAEPSAAGLEPPRGRGIDQFLAHVSGPSVFRKTWESGVKTCWSNQFARQNRLATAIHTDFSGLAIARCLVYANAVAVG